MQQDTGVVTNAVTFRMSLDCRPVRGKMPRYRALTRITPEETMRLSLTRSLLAAAIALTVLCIMLLALINRKLRVCEVAG